MRFDVGRDRTQIDGVHDAVAREVHRLGFEESSVFAVRLALEEAIANALRHGSPNGEPIQVEIESESTPAALTISVEDHGPGFDPDSIPDPTAPENLDKPSGRGLLLIRTYMSDVRFNETGNRITMVYRAD